MIDLAPLRAVTSPLQLIGGTPLVRVGCFDTAGSELWLKLESLNPGGSIKDRIGLAMIEAAEDAGALTPGTPGHLVEATAGNTGLGLALVAAIRGGELPPRCGMPAAGVATPADAGAWGDETTRHAVHGNGQA